MTEIERPAAAGAAAPPARHINVRGVDLAVRDRGSGTPFLWAHGLLCSMAADEASALFDWRSLGGAQVVRYDARGHGESDTTDDPAAFRWDNLAEDMIALSRAAGLARPVLGGASMGCATALHAAVRAPDLPRGLVLVIPPTAWATRPRQQRFYRFAAGMIDRFGTGLFESTVGLVQRFLPRPDVLKGPTSRVHDAFMTAVSQVDRVRTPLIMQGASLSDFPDEADVAALRVPTLILSWEGDPSHPRSSAEKLVDLLPNATWKHARRPSDVLAWPRRVQQFIEELPAGE